MTDLTMWGKIIDLNKSKTGIIADSIEEYRLDSEYTRYGKRDLRKPKDL